MTILLVIQINYHLRFNVRFCLILFNTITHYIYWIYSIHQNQIQTRLYIIELLLIIEWKHLYYVHNSNSFSYLSCMGRDQSYMLLVPSILISGSPNASWIVSKISGIGQDSTYSRCQRDLCIIYSLEHSFRNPINSSIAIDSVNTFICV